MIHKKIIEGHEVFAIYHEVCQQNDKGNYEGGQYGATFCVDHPPEHLGEWVKDENGHTRLFPTRKEAIDAAFVAAEERLKNP